MCIRDRLLLLPGSKLFLPIILRLTNNISLLPNGNFEQGRVIWQESSQKGYAILYNISQTSNAAPPHSGNWAAWLGGALGEISSIQQSVTIPPEKPILSYWHWIASEDSCGYDFGGVLVNNSVIDMYALCDDQDTHGWTLHAVDLSAYKGQTVFLEIRAETDDLYNSNLFIDDVGFQTSLAAQFEVGTQKSQRINPTKADWNIQSLTMVTPVPPIRLFSPSYFVPRMRQ
ncbi:MAG: hypothetical protein N3D16_07835, partial [Anaerolineales bacterium]|nr:hypothetical protein [Anaerolineales bacterium]